MLRNRTAVFTNAITVLESGTALFTKTTVVLSSRQAVVNKNTIVPIREQLFLTAVLQRYTVASCFTDTTIVRRSGPAVSHSSLSDFILDSMLCCKNPYYILICVSVIHPFSHSYCTIRYSHITV
jgi:hypothetical protein